MRDWFRLRLSSGRPEGGPGGSTHPTRGSLDPLLEMTSPEEELVFAPLGGAGEIGMNLSVYGLGSPRKKAWLSVDLGVAFSGADLPRLQILIPHLPFLV